mmetsp:Transcript_16507/g.47493  ORF Transcript_16507/g.47493 Transcript_16507/m.47493 type:complete len:223 (+) Transcript_16507:591-1259(+)
MIDAAHRLQCSRHQFTQAVTKHSNDGPLCPGRVGHWAQNVEARTDAQPLADGSDVPHGGVIHGSEHEGHARLIHTLDHLFGTQRHLHAQPLQDVGASAGRRHATIATLGHGAAARRGEDNARRGDVDGVGSVATGAHNVQQLLSGEVDGVARLVHGPDHSGDLLGGFAAGAEEGEEGSDLDLIGSLEDFIKGRLGLLGGEVTLACDKGFDERLEGGHVGANF